MAASVPRRTTGAAAMNCGDCGMPVQRRLRYCPSCGRPISARHTFLISIWQLIVMWVTVVLVVYMAIAVLRFVVPVTLRVTCSKQVVPARLVLMRTASYESWLTAGDCSVPPGTLVVLRTVPPWLRDIAHRDTKTPAGAAYAALVRGLTPVGTAVTNGEQAVLRQARLSWQNAVTDLCTPTWLAQWCGKR